MEIVSKRQRDLSLYKGLKECNYQSLEDLLRGEVGEGVHSVKYEKYEFDFIYENNDTDSDLLLVFFPSAANVNLKTYPLIQGRGVAKKARVSILSFGDPLVSDAGMTTGWLLGDESTQFYGVVQEITAKFSQGRKLVFFGISAGGFPALQVGRAFRNSLSLVVNSRTSLLTPPTNFYFYADRYFEGWSVDEIREKIPLSVTSAPNTVFYYQNSQDFRYLPSHAFPYFEKFAATGNIYFKFGEWGLGHKAMDKLEMIKIFKTLKTCSSWESAAELLEVSLCNSAEEVKRKHAQLMVESGRFGTASV